MVPRLLDDRGALSLSLRNDPTIARAVGLGSLGLDRFSETISDPQRYRRPTAVDWATGAAMPIAADCFAELGGWDESFFLYSEETDFCLRARQHGWSVRYTPAAEATHTGGGSGSKRGAARHGAGQPGPPLRSPPRAAMGLPLPGGQHRGRGLVDRTPQVGLGGGVDDAGATPTETARAQGRPKPHPGLTLPRLLRHRCLRAAAFPLRLTSHRPTWLTWWVAASTASIPSERTLAE